MDRMGSNAANNCPPTPLGFLGRTATVYGDCLSIVYRRTVYTWSQTLRRRRRLRLASSLSSLGISRCDVASIQSPPIPTHPQDPIFSSVSVLAPNVPAMYEMQFGIPTSGVTPSESASTPAPSPSSSATAAPNSSSSIPCPSLLRDALCFLPDSHQPPGVVPIEDPYEECWAQVPYGVCTKVPAKLQRVWLGPVPASSVWFEPVSVCGCRRHRGVAVVRRGHAWVADWRK